MLNLLDWHSVTRIGLIVLKWNLSTFAAIFFGLIFLTDNEDGITDVPIRVSIGRKVANRHRVGDQLLLRMLKKCG